MKPITAIVEKAEKKSLSLATAVKNMLSLEGKLDNAINGVRVSAFDETVKNGWSASDLGGKLKEAGMSDPARVSEIVGWVFPQTSANRQILNEMLSFNVNNPLERQWTKQEVLAVQRSKEATTGGKVRAALELAKEKKNTAPLTAVEQAKKLAESEAEKARKAKEAEEAEAVRVSKLTALEKIAEEDDNRKRVETRLQGQLAEVMKAYAKHGYDITDFAGEIAVVESLVKVFTPPEPLPTISHNEINEIQTSIAHALAEAQAKTKACQPEPEPTTEG